MNIPVTVVAERDAVGNYEGQFRMPTIRLDVMRVQPPSLLPASLTGAIVTILDRTTPSVMCGTDPPGGYSALPVARQRPPLGLRTATARTEVPPAIADDMRVYLKGLPALIARSVNKCRADRRTIALTRAEPTLAKTDRLRASKERFPTLFADARPREPALLRPDVRLPALLGSGELALVRAELGIRLRTPSEEVLTALFTCSRDGTLSGHRSTPSVSRLRLLEQRGGFRVSVVSIAWSKGGALCRG
jgi:hypothetical protein